MIKEWIKSLEWKKTKNYTHFDIKNNFKDSQSELVFYESLLSDNNISNHNFWPFIRYVIREKRFTLYEEDTPDNNFFYENSSFWNLFWLKEKIRPLTYASHIDSMIFSYYSFLLWIEYEKFLQKNNLDTNIIAYRSIKEKDWKGKNNINFSIDAFTNIVNNKDCIVIAFDISKFFDSLNHKILKQNLINILWVSTLNESWYKIYNSLTKFSYIPIDFIKKNNLIKIVWKYNKIIDIKKFNEVKRILNKEWKKIIEKNINKYWIPQWTPISWMLANIYMYQFDILIKNKVNKYKWSYYRYSDDILLIIPCNNKEYLNCITEISNSVTNSIKENLNLKINNSKTEISIFLKWKLYKNVKFNTKTQKYEYKNEKITKPFQYLWFTFDWNKVLIRNKTLSNYYKKMINTLKRLYHLKDMDKNWNSHIKWDRILLWKTNRKYLFNWEITWTQNIRKENKWIKSNISKSYYLWFISYWYKSYYTFKNFCEKNSITNWIRKQLSWHSNKFNKFLKKYWIK